VNAIPGIVVASFPKAGSTWVRFLIANLFNQVAPEIEAVDFHSIHDIVPEIGRPDARRHFSSMPPVWKTHDPWQRSFDRVVLVLRNPWDTLYSYYHYLTGEHGRTVTLRDVVTDGRHGAAAVVRHAASYLGRCHDLLVIAYEDLHAVPQPEVRRLAEFLGVAATDRQVTEAVNASSFQSMQASECSKGRRYGGGSFRFMRHGAVGEGYAAIALEPGLDRHVRRELARCPALEARYAGFTP